MSTENWKSEPNLLTYNEIENEKKRIEQILVEVGISITHFDFLIYLKLLPIVTAASQEEFSSAPLDVQMRMARLNAAKLAILFGSVDEVIQYLERFKKQSSTQQKIMHRACLFTLPSGQHWDLKIWQELVAKQKPSHSNDLIFRLLPFAEKIETYVRENRETLIEEIEREVSSYYELKFSLQFDFFSNQKLKGEWISSKLATMKKAMIKEVEYEFSRYLRTCLDLPSGKLDAEQSQRLQKRINNLSEKDHSKRTELTKRIQEKYAAKAEANYNKFVFLLRNKTKKEYLSLQLKKSEREIATIIKEREERMLSPLTPMNVLFKYLTQVCYQRAKENPEVAGLFFQYGLLEASFDKYLSLQPQNDDKLIPYIFIEGEEIAPQYKNHYIKKLRDPQVASVLGELTSCCQSLGRAGERPTIHGITSPTGGFYVLYEKQATGRDNIVAQCWAWRSEDGDLVFDSVESQIDFRNKNELLIADFYTYLAHHLVTNNEEIKRVLVGTGKTPPAMRILHPLSEAYPANYFGYSDSDEQFIVADQQLPFMQLYLNTNPQSLLSLPQVTKNLGREEIKEWCDLCVANNKKELSEYINDHLSSAGLDERFVSERLTTGIKWMRFLRANTRELRGDFRRKLQNFVEKGVNLEIPSKITIMFLAAYEKKEEIIKFLTENGAHINVRHGTYSLLHVVLMHENLDSFKYLIEKGADIQVKDDFGNTLLHSAAKLGLLDIVHFLVEQGLDLQAKNSVGKTALDLAKGASRRHSETVIAYLEKQQLSQAQALPSYQPKFFHLRKEIQNSEIEASFSPKAT